MWENGSPFSISHFRNPNFKQAIRAEYKYTFFSPFKFDRSTKKLFPHRIFSKTCTLLVLNNLLEPNWMFLACNDKRMNSYFCVKEEVKNNSQNYEKNYRTVEAKKDCPSTHVRMDKKCYSFLWYNLTETDADALRRVCHPHSALSTASLHFLQPIFNAVSNAFPDILLNGMSGNFKAIHSKLFTIQTSRTETTHPPSQGLVFCQRPLFKVNTKGIHIYACKLGGFVSILHKCDGEIDCPNDASDEMLCNCTSSTQRVSDSVLNRCAAKGHCPSLFYMAKDHTCHKYFAENKSVSIPRTPTQLTVRCPSFVFDKIKVKMQHISKELVDDLVADCGPHAEDEPILLSLLLNNTQVPCENPSDLPCLQGHPKCYNISNICIFELDTLNHLTPCRNGGHMDQCEMFQCNARYKCESSYCIPWSYLCNGRWDCPHGEEEYYQPVCGDNNLCSHMYKCKNVEKLCIHMSSVCDGKIDCHLKDDEDVCQFKSAVCPENCSCMLQAVKCVNFLETNKITCFSLLSISITKSDLQNSWKIFGLKFSEALFLQFTDNNISNVCGHKLPSKLLSFTVNNNKIVYLVSECFQSLLHLRELQLIQNLLGNIHYRAFANLKTLKMLDMSNNPFTHLPEKLFTSNTLLVWLSINNVTFSCLPQNIFQEVEIRYIGSTDHHVCCVSPSNSICPAVKPWHIPCSELLPDVKMQVFFVVLSLSIFSLNIFSLLLHSLSWKSNQAFVSIVVPLNMADLLSFGYFTIIWASHMFYKARFLFHEKLWRETSFCFTAFGTIFSFSLLTQMLLTLLSLSRLMVVVTPVDSNFKQFSFVLRLVLTVVTASISASVGTTIVTQFTIDRLPFSLCLPFVDPTNSSIVIKFIALFTTSSQFTVTIAILFMHILLIIKVLQSKKNVQNSKQNESNAWLTVQLVLMTTSNILCWLPTGGIYVAALCLRRYPPKLIVWATVVILPLNSICNPVLFCVFAIRKCVRARQIKQ